MADPRRFELDELTLRPGTYFNPETEVLIVVDDSVDIDQTIFDGAEESATEADWVLVSDEVPIDEPARDELVEGFQARYHGGTTTALPDEEAPDDEDDAVDADDDEDEDDGVEELV